MKVAMVNASYSDYSFEENMFQEAGLDLVVYDNHLLEDILDKIKDSDVLLVNYEEVSANLLAQMPNLKVIGRCGAGVNNIDVSDASRLGISVINVPDYCVEEVAVTTCSMILALQRKLIPAVKLVQENRWGDLDALKPIAAFSELTLGLIGLGRIGSKVTNLMRPFVCNIITSDPYVKQDSVPEGATLVSLDELLAEADIISIHSPLTDETKYLINEQTISLMRKKPIIVNVSRGLIINEGDLLHAINNGQISYAALDVLEHEPPDMSNPLINHPKVLVTNHLAWYSESSEPRLRKMLASRIIDCLEGRFVPTIVNRDQLAQ